MKMALDTSQLELAAGEQIVNEYSTWQLAREMPKITPRLVLLTLFSFGIYFAIKYLLALLSSGRALITDRRLVLFIQWKNVFTDKILIDSVSLSSIIGMNTFNNSLIQEGGRPVENIAGKAAEQVFCDILEMRYEEGSI